MTFLDFFVLALFGLVCFLPTWVAFGRKHHQRYAIAALNVLLGATGIGWIAALIWALTAVRRSKPSDQD